MLSHSFRAAILFAFSLIIVASAIEVLSPLITLPFAKHISLSGTVNIVEHDQARVAALFNIGYATSAHKYRQRAMGSAPIVNDYVVYLASVAVGSPATTYKLFVDTGSSLTWVGGVTPYSPTSTSTNTDLNLNITYGVGYFHGTEYIDQVALGNFVISNQSIGVASDTSFKTFDGMLGLGPTDLTKGAVSSKPLATIPTVVDNLYSQGLISQKMFSILFKPAGISNSDAEITFGGIDTSKFTGTLNFTPLSSAPSVSGHWGIDQSISYGSTKLLDIGAGLVDTGTTLILLSNDALMTYQNLTGAVLDKSTGFLQITSAQYAGLVNLYFTINSITYTLTPNAQIWPRQFNTYLSGGDANAIYLIVCGLGSVENYVHLKFINGKSFIERFYTVFDEANSRIGFATTSYTSMNIN